MLLILSSSPLLQRRCVSSAVMACGVVHAERRRDQWLRFGTAIFAGVDRLFCPFVELVFPPNRAVGVTHTQPYPRQLTNALEQLAAVLAIKVF